MIYFFDLLGTFIFAITGAFRAVKYELDILGVMVLSVATGVGGGIMRDVILGITPPAAIGDEKYLLICILGGLLVFFAAPRIAKVWSWVKILDAFGLAVFTALGAQKGALHGLGPIGIVMMGTISSTGGGVVRDILVREIPAVIRTDFYATAAAIGSLCLFGILFRFPRERGWAMVTALAVTFTLRLVAIKWKLNLPKVHMLKKTPSEIEKERKKKKKLKE